MEKILTMRDVTHITSLSRSVILRLVKKNEFPKPFKLSDKRYGWKEYQIRDWCLSLKEANTGYIT